MSFDGRLRDVILIVQDGPFTADDFTGNGALTVAGNHDPNGTQNAIGAAFRLWAARGWIEPTGDYVRSNAPRRKGGMIRVWRATSRGRAWATGSDRLL